MQDREFTVGFTSLPPELRSAIYKLLPLSHTVRLSPPSWRRSKEAWPATPLSLACTCRTVYQEFAPLYYSGVKYSTSMSDWYSVGLWLEVIKPWAGNTIKGFTIRWVPQCTLRFWWVKVLDGGQLQDAPPGWSKRIEWQSDKRKRARIEAQDDPNLTVDGLGRRWYKKRHSSRPTRVTRRKYWKDSVEKIPPSKPSRLTRGEGKWIRD